MSCHKVDSVTVWQPDAERLFRLLESHRDERPDMLAYAVTSFFCGSRSVEILRAAEGEDAAKINIEDETVRIAKGKGYQRGRVVIRSIL